MKRWYYIKKGLTKGPITSKGIKEKIELGDLGPMDMVTLQGSESWKSLVQYEEFKKVFKDLPPPDASDQWVVLLEDLKSQSKRYIQKGPYTGDVVRQKIQKGDIKYTDFVWREGMKEWYKISLLEAFQKKAEFPPVPSQTSSFLSSPEGELTSEDLLKNVVQQKKIVKKVKSEKVPEEAVGEDLTEPGVLEKRKEQEIKQRVQDIVTQVKRSSKKEPKAKSSIVVAGRSKKSPEKVSEKTEEIEIEIDSKPEEKRFDPDRRKPKSDKRSEGDRRSLKSKKGSRKERRKAESEKRSSKERRQPQSERRGRKPPLLRPPLIHFLFIGGILILAGLLVTFSSYLDVSQTKRVILKKVRESKAIRKVVDFQKETPIKAVANKKGLKKGKSQSGKVPPKKVVVAKKPPSFLKIMTRLKAKSPFIQFITDASHHFPIKVLLEGQAGQVLKNKSVYKVFWRPPGEINKVSLSSFGEGYYKLRAEVDGIVRHRKFFLGRNGRQFRRKLNQHRKQLSYWHQMERYSFIKASYENYGLIQSLKRGVRQKGRVWSKFYPSWKKRYYRANSSEMKRIRENISHQFVHASYWLKLKEIRTELRSQSRKFHKLLMANKKVNIEPVKRLEEQTLLLKNQAQKLSLFR